MVVLYQQVVLQENGSLGKDVWLIASTVTNSLDLLLNIVRQINHGRIMHQINVLKVS